MDEDVAALRRMADAGKMEPYLRHIRFPRFRNLADGLRVDLTFPVTALIGANGTNKTAVLRALEGAPDYQNIGVQWFSTAVDPIEDARGGNRIRFIHGWIPPSVGSTVEALKQREPSSDDPDYFEPAKPRTGDAMEPMGDGVGVLNEGRGRTGRRERSADRWNPIPKPVEYIDFRSELSAYDKYFFHNRYRRRAKDPSSLPAEERSRKALVRDRAPHLRKALLGHRSSNRLGGTERIHDRVVLPPEEVSAISDILGRTYESVVLVEHSFYEVRGWTVLLRSGEHSYSEAFAGSGEFAVVRLVHRIMTAEEAALVLLDEPETSLHPGAQRHLIRFILRQAKVKRLQVVFSTHSPELVAPLPPDAIKVLQVRPDDGRVELRSQTSLPDEAFVVVGREVERKTIFVEDDLAAEIVRHALRIHRPELLRSLDAKAHPGGHADLTKTCVSWALTDERRVLVLLDGDRSVEVDGASSELAGEALAHRIADVTGIQDLPLARSSNEPIEGAQRRFISWWERNVRYLPGSQPESLLLSMIGESTDAEDAKGAWVDRTQDDLPFDPSIDTVRSPDILATQRRALADVPIDDPLLRAIADTVTSWLADRE